MPDNEFDAALDAMEAEQRKLQRPRLTRPTAIPGVESRRGGLVSRFTPQTHSVMDRAGIEAVLDGYGKLPITARGMSGTHRRMGWNHNDALDIGIDPDSQEGQSVLGYLRERNVPYTAISGPIPGQSTGKHIHAGEPSRRLTAPTLQSRPVQPHVSDDSDLEDLARSAFGGSQPQPTPQATPQVAPQAPQTPQTPQQSDDLDLADLAKSAGLDVLKQPKVTSKVIDADDDSARTPGTVGFNLDDMADRSAFVRSAAGYGSLGSNERKVGQPQNLPGLLGKPIKFSIPGNGPDAQPDGATIGQAFLKAIGPDAADAYWRYKGETGRELADLSGFTPERLRQSYNPKTKAFEISEQPTQRLIRSINALNSSGYEGLKREVEAMRKEDDDQAAKLKAASEQPRTIGDAVRGAVSDSGIAATQYAQNVANIGKKTASGIGFGQSPDEVERQRQLDQASIDESASMVPRETGTVNATVRKGLGAVGTLPESLLGGTTPVGAGLSAFVGASHRPNDEALLAGIEGAGTAGAFGAAGKATRNLSPLKRGLVMAGVGGATQAGLGATHGETSLPDVVGNFVTGAGMGGAAGIAKHKEAGPKSDPLSIREPVTPGVPVERVTAPTQPQETTARGMNGAEQVNAPEQPVQARRTHNTPAQLAEMADADLKARIAELEQRPAKGTSKQVRMLRGLELVAARKEVKTRRTAKVPPVTFRDFVENRPGGGVRLESLSVNDPLYQQLKAEYDRKYPGAGRPVPEAPPTIDAQMDALTTRARNAVLITPGTQLPKVPQGFVVTKTSQGRVIHDPQRFTPEVVGQLDKSNELHRLLGILKPKDGTQDAALVARTPQGAESQSVAVNTADAANVAKQAEVLKQQNPGATVSVEDPAQVIKERRVDNARRQRVAQMSPQALRRELLTHPVTGIPNLRAYDDAPKKPVQVITDVDSLKAVNDHLGHEAGDELLKAKAQALKDEGIEAYHVSGDEFRAQFNTEQEARAAMDRAAARLRGATIEATTPDGKTIKYEGPGFSYGIGKDKATADAALRQHKSARETSGERAARGEKPRGMGEVTPEGQQVARNTPAQKVSRPPLVDPSKSTAKPRAANGNEDIFDTPENVAARKAEQAKKEKLKVTEGKLSGDGVEFDQSTDRFFVDGSPTGAVRKPDGSLSVESTPLPKGPAAQKALGKLQRVYDSLPDGHKSKAAVGETVQKLQAELAQAEAKKQDLPAGYGDGNKIVSKGRADAARARLAQRKAEGGAAVGGHGKQAGTSTIIPDIIDLVEVGAYHVEAGARSFAEFSKRMIEEAGEQVRPHLEEIYRRAVAKASITQEDLDSVRVEDYVNLPKENLSPETKVHFARLLKETVLANPEIRGRSLSPAELRAEAAKLDPDFVLHLKPPKNGESYNDAVRVAAHDMRATLNPLIVDLSNDIENNRTRYSFEDLEKKQQELARLERDWETLSNLIIPMRSGAGRSLSVYKMFAQETFDPDFWIGKARRSARRAGTDLESQKWQDVEWKLREELAAGQQAKQKVTDLQQQIADLQGQLDAAKSQGTGTKSGSDNSKQSNAQLVDTIRKLNAELEAQKKRVNISRKNVAVKVHNASKQSAVTILSTLRKAGLLASVRSMVEDATSTSIFQIAEEAATLPASVLDLAMAHFSDRQRSISASAYRHPIKTTKAIAGGWLTGVKEAPEIMRHGTTLRKVANLDFPPDMETRWPMMDKVANAVFHAREAIDNVNYNAAIRRDMLERARVVAINEARAGKFPKSKINERTMELIKNPSAAMVTESLLSPEAIEAGAKESTFHSDNPITRFIQGGRQRSSATTNAAIDLIMPFERSVTNVFLRGAEYTGAGAPIAVVRAMRVLTKKGIPIEQRRAIAKQFGRGTGGAGLTAIGFILASQGKLTGAPTDPNVGRVDKAAGHEAMSVYVPGTGKWISYKALGPLAIPLAVGALTYETWSKYHDESLPQDARAGKAAIVAGKGLWRTATNIPLLRSASDTISALENPTQISSTAGRIAGSFVPTPVADIAAMTDSKERDPQGFTDNIKRRIPGLRQSIPESIDVIGRPVEYHKTDALNPFKPRTAKEITSTIDRELTRLRVGIGQIQAKATETPAEIRERRVKAGKSVEKVLSNAFDSAEYEAVKQDVVRKSVVADLVQYGRAIQGKKFSDEQIAHNVRARVSLTAVKSAVFKQNFLTKEQRAKASSFISSFVRDAFYTEDDDRSPKEIQQDYRMVFEDLWAELPEKVAEIRKDEDE